MRLRLTDRYDGDADTLMNSYSYLRNLLHEQRVAIVVGEFDWNELWAFGERSEEEAEELIAAEVNESLTDAGLDAVESVEHRGYGLGRSSSTLITALYIAGSVVGIFQAAKSIDDGWPVLKKWARAIRHQLRRWRHGQVSLEGVKILCLCDLNERFGDDTGPVPELITHAGRAAQVGDGTWEIVTPLVIAIPDAKRQCTHIYSVNLAGEILHHSEHPVFNVAANEALDGNPGNPLLAPVDPSLCVACRFHEAEVCPSCDTAYCASCLANYTCSSV